MLEAKIFEKMTLHAKKSLFKAADLAKNQGLSEVEPFHLLWAIYQENGSLGSNILKDSGLKKSYFSFFSKKSSLQKNPPSTSSKKLPPSKSLQKIILTSFTIASKMNYPYVGTEHLVYAMSESADKKIHKIFDTKSFHKENLKNLMRLPFSQNPYSEFNAPFNLSSSQSLTKKQTSTFLENQLSQFCLNLNQETQKNPEPITGRENELERMIHILGRKNKNNPLLIGQPGVGKTALVLALTQKINQGDVPLYLADKIIYSLDIASVVAGTTFRGEFENRLKEIISYAQKNKNVILFIDELHIIVGAGNTQGGLDAANILKPALSNGNIQCIGATTFDEYKKYIEKDSALSRRFQTIKLNEPSIENSQKMLQALKKYYEKFHQLKISDEAIDSAVELSARYITDRFLPDKAFDLLDETASAKKNQLNSTEQSKLLKKYQNELKKVFEKKQALTQATQYEQAIEQQKTELLLLKKISDLKNNFEKNSSFPNLEKKDVVETLSKITGIPSEKIALGQEKSKILDIEKKLNQKIIGQTEVIRSVSQVLLRAQSGVGNPDRPLGSFLFLGPSGSGKTLTAKTIAQEIFSTPDSLIKIDMSEFGEKHTVSRLIGAPAGYVGFEEGGLLTEKVRHQPYSLILFDEIEKAHPQVLNLLLQILEDGTLTDAQGQKINFKNTIVILTANLANVHFGNEKKLGFSNLQSSNNSKNFQIGENSDLIKNLSENLKPEILNRLDHILIFKNLSAEDLKKIILQELNNLVLRLKKQGLVLIFSAEVLDFLQQKNFIDEYGARLIRKNIQDWIETALAQFILEKPHQKKISLSIKKNQVVVQKFD